MCSWFFVSLASALALQVLVLYKQERNKDSSVVYLMIVEEVCFSSEKYFLCCVLCFAFSWLVYPPKMNFIFQVIEAVLLWSWDVGLTTAQVLVSYVGFSARHFDQGDLTFALKKAGVSLLAVQTKHGRHSSSSSCCCDKIKIISFFITNLQSLGLDKNVSCFLLSSPFA